MSASSLPPGPPQFDPGLTQKYTGALNRTIKDNGQFNVRRRGRRLRDRNPYLYLVSAPGPVFVLIIAACFAAVNLLFAYFYMLLGPGHLGGGNTDHLGSDFWNAFFFSIHTLTTVGYGNIFPVGLAANLISAAEALTGLMGFAIVTGLVFGRFSRPTARIGFSHHALVAPYREGTALELRIVNRRTNNLLELEARVMLMTVQSENGQLKRKFDLLSLERPQVTFFPLTWTIVHPITPDSPLYGKTRESLAVEQAELLVFIKAYDETFGQMVHSRRSYRHNEWIWGARFTPAFEVDSDGELRLETNRVSSFERVPLP